MKMRVKEKSKRGITLLETVISIALISTVVAAALTLMVSQAKIRKRTLDTIEATAIAENALECYAHADEGEFARLLALTLGITESEVKLGEEISVGNMTLKLFHDGELLHVEVSGSGKTIVERSAKI